MSEEFDRTIRKTSDQQQKIYMRLPDGMREELKLAARANGRTMNAEVVGRLEASLAQGDPAGVPMWDFYAAHALSGICANPECAALPEHHAAEMASKAADAMMEAREKVSG